MLCGTDGQIKNYYSIIQGGVSMEEYIVIYTPYITIKGKRIYASRYGLKAFKLCIPKDRYRAK